MEKKMTQRLWPFTLTAAIIILDQLTKWIVSVTVRPWSVGASFGGDLLRIVNVYNPGIAFSIGVSMEGSIRSILFGLLPLAVIGIVLVVYFRSEELTGFQRWCVAGIVGGGIGNLLDRFFRPEGVLDFIDVKFFGLFGFDRWPTFNVADSSVVVCGILLIVSLLLSIKGTKDGSHE